MNGGGAIHASQVLNNAGTINWTGGNFCVGDGATLNNTSGASFTAESGNGFTLYNCYGGAAPRVHNASGATFTRRVVFSQTFRTTRSRLIASGLPARSFSASAAW